MTVITLLFLISVYVGVEVDLGIASWVDVEWVYDLWVGASMSHTRDEAVVETNV